MKNRPIAVAVLIIAAVTLLRIVVLFTSDLQLYPDEAQYWWWAVHPDWGYFSKPPFIAWLINASMRVCGEGEACLRIGSPLLHAATALVLLPLTRALYDARAAMWTSLLYLTLPGISYSAGLISTDVPLLFFWSVALLAFIELIRPHHVTATHDHWPSLTVMKGRDHTAALRRASHDDDKRTETRWGWAILCGAAIGFGCLSKYAMLYFVLGAGVAAFLVPATRRVILSLNGIVIVAVAALIFTPNILWNVQHHFATVQHTAANANWSHAGENLSNAAAFIGGQFGAFGPILMAGYLYGVWRALRDRDDMAGRILASFSAPILLIITVQSFISEANANWAAAAYVAVTPLAVHTILDAIGRAASRWAIGITAAINGLALLAISVFAISPAAVEAAGLGNAYKRFHGWRELAAVVKEEAATAPYRAVVVDNRSVTAALLYYARPLAAPIRVWDADAHPDNHFQMTLMLEPTTRGRVLLVTDALHPEERLASFAHARLTRLVSLAVGGGRSRTTRFFDADGYRGPTAAPPTSR